MELIDRHPVAAYAIGALLLLFIIRYIATSVREEWKIRSLGGHAPRVTTWLPWGIDFVAKAIKSSSRFEDLRFWQGLLNRHANPARPFTVETSTGGQRLIFTIDDENIKAILATQFSDYGKGERFHKDWHDFLGDSIFTTDGDMWHASRQLLRPQFIKDRVSDLNTFERHVKTLIPLLGGGGRPGSPVNLVDVFYRYTLDAATDFLLGSSVDSMKKVEDKFADAFAVVQHEQNIIALAGPLNPLVPRKKFYASLKVMEDFIQPFIEQTLRLPQEELEKKSKSDEGYTFLHALAGFTRDPKVLRDQLVAVLLAGRDTTAMTLSWMFYELSRRPEIVAKLRKEIGQHFGADKNPTYADLKSMRYLQHTINETLRLYPVVPFNIRMALKDTTLPHGGGPDGMQPIGVLKGTSMAYSTLGMQCRPDIYPPTSEKFPHHMEFSPERWDNWHPKLWTYIPFNAGPRICIGQQFALTEIAYTAVRILQNYTGVQNVMTKPAAMKVDIVMQPAHGVDVVFSR